MWRSDVANASRLRTSAGSRRRWTFGMLTGRLVPAAAAPLNAWYSLPLFSMMMVFKRRVFVSTPMGLMAITLKFSKKTRLSFTRPLGIDW